MRTVKEVSELTGISVRTLHWYDEIGLLKPTATSEKGYRLYDDKALEKLQQILFFREFDMPLKGIRAIFEQSDFDREQILRSQRKLLKLKRERLDRLIGSIDGILKGENEMDFNVFNQDEIEEMYQTMIGNFTEEMRAAVIEEYGGLEEHHKHFVDFALSEKGQKHYQKVAELYGDKQSALRAMKYSLGRDVVEAYQKRIDLVMKKLAEKRAEQCSAESLAVRECIGEYGFLMKQMYALKDEAALMRGIAEEQTREPLKTACDESYGEGMADFFADAVEYFYREK